MIFPNRRILLAQACIGYLAVSAVTSTPTANQTTTTTEHSTSHVSKIYTTTTTLEFNRTFAPTTTFMVSLSPTPSPKKEITIPWLNLSIDTSNPYIVGGAVAVVVLIITVILAACICCCRGRKNRKTEYENGKYVPSATGTVSDQTPKRSNTIVKKHPVTDATPYVSHGDLTQQQQPKSEIMQHPDLTPVIPSRSQSSAVNTTGANGLQRSNTYQNSQPPTLQRQVAQSNNALSYAQHQAPSPLTQHSQPPTQSHIQIQQQYQQSQQQSPAHLNLISTFGYVPIQNDRGTIIDVAEVIPVGQYGNNNNNNASPFGTQQQQNGGGSVQVTSPNTFSFFPGQQTQSSGSSPPPPPMPAMAPSAPQTHGSDKNTISKSSSKIGSKDGSTVNLNAANGNIFRKPSAAIVPVLSPQSTRISHTALNKSSTMTGGLKLSTSNRMGSSESLSAAAGKKISVSTAGSSTPQNGTVVDFAEFVPRQQ